MKHFNVLAVARRWISLLVLGPLLSGLAAYYVVREIPPVYEARVTLLVGQGSIGTGSGNEDLRGTEYLAKTFSEVVKMRSVLDAAATQSGLTEPAADLQDRVSARLVRDTQLLRVVAQDTDPVAAAQLANAVAESLVEKTLSAQASRFASSRENLSKLVDSQRIDVDVRQRQVDQLTSQPFSQTRDVELARLQSELAQLQAAYSASVRSYEELRIVEARRLDTLTILEPADVPGSPVGPQKTRSLLLAVLAGLAVVIAVVIAAEYLDDGLRDRERVSAATGLITIGTVPRSGVNGDGDPGGERRLMESYRLLLLNIQVGTLDRSVESLIITSAGVREGKSTTASNLAVVCAEAGQRVILVDADLHRPTLADRFKLSREVGFSSILLNPIVPISDALQQTHAPNLRVLTSGPTPADPSALLSSRRLADRLRELRADCDMLIFDSPPLLAQPDAALLGTHVDAAVFVVDVTRTRGRAASRALEILRGSAVEIVGVVMNKVPHQAMDYVTYGYAAQADTQDEQASLPANGKADKSTALSQPKSTRG